MPAPTSLPDFDALPLSELRAWRAAIGAGIAALEAAGGGDAAILADAEGVSVTITVNFPEEPRCPKPASTCVRSRARS